MRRVLGDDAAILARSSGEGRRDDSVRTRRKILISTQVLTAFAAVPSITLAAAAPATAFAVPSVTTAAAAAASTSSSTAAAAASSATSPPAAALLF